MLSLAVAVIIGAAFGSIVTSLTDDIIMPVVGAVMGGLDFSNYFFRLGALPEGYSGDPHNYAALKAAGVPMLGYGQFVTAVVNFLILALIILQIVRAASRIVPEKTPEASRAPSENTRSTAPELMTAAVTQTDAS